MANAKTVEAVEVEVRIAANPETVFDFFVEPDRMIQWMGRSARLDARAGGEFYVDINGDAIASGEYVALEPPDRVVFTWGWNSEDSVTSAGSTTVEVLLEAVGEETNVRLIHSDLPSEESATKHGHGWRHYLARLSEAAAGRDAGPDEYAKG